MNIDTLRRALADPQRSIMGAEQEEWLEVELRRSARAGIPWQIIGQQLLVGKLFTPQVADEEFAPEQRESIVNGRYGMLRARGQQGLPLNMDAWDGYPANRERMFNAIQEHANNVVILAGDTHSSWAFDLEKDNGEAVAVEFGTPSVSSPGFENFLAIPTDRLEQATLQSSPELKYFKANGRGWVELEITPQQVSALWQFVSTVTDQRYEVIAGAALRTRAGHPMIEMA